ncbi:TPA: glycosyltransferase family 2 protein [Candidatus Woesearchaeota archaeon]|nr:glycosyltransferase family 2 protein [Candidatus Woesearchaeota archaeon]
MNVVVSIPAYNEEATIAAVIRNIKLVLGKHRNYSYRVLVVDDGSTDRTAEAAKNEGAAVHSHPKNYGLAETFRTEVDQFLKMKPQADAMVHIDADGQYKAEEIPSLLKRIEEGNDFVLGSRFKGHIERMPLVKKLGNKAFAKVISQITRTRISDPQSGFRAFTREVAEKVPIISSHTYTQEQVIRVVKNKFRIAEVPVYFAERKGKSRLIRNPLEYAIKAWINILRIMRDYEPLKFFGLTGAAMFAAGFILGLRLLYFYFTTGIVGHIPSIILSVLLMSIGVQVITFGFLADMMKR